MESPGAHFTFVLSLTIIFFFFLVSFVRSLTGASISILFRLMFDLHIVHRIHFRFGITVTKVKITKRRLVIVIESGVGL